MWNFKTYGINFLFFLGSCVIRKLVHLSWWELESVCAGGGMGRGYKADSFLFVGVCVCLWGGGWAEWAWSGIKCCSRSKIFVTLIFHDHLHYCEIFLAPFLISSVFNKAATIVLHKISSLHIVWFSHINICVVTKQMRDKTTRKVNKWPVTKATLRFFL